MKVDGSIHSLIQGVSQQPPKVRLMGQCTLQENCSSNPVDGLTRRPPTDRIKTLCPLLGGEQYYDFTLKNVDYILVLTNDTAKIFDLGGNEYITNLGTGAIDYLTGDTLAFTSIEDKTYIANSAITVLMLDDTKEYAPKSSIVHMAGGQYGRSYNVTVTWDGGEETFTYTSPNGGKATDAPKVATTYIASHLETAFNANSTLTDDFNITRKDDVLWIALDDDSSITDFTVSVDDGDGGSRMYVTNSSTIDVGNLPRYAPQGYFAAITGSGTADVDDYYLQFEVTGGADIGDGFGEEGVWTETVQRDIPYLLDTSTMPYILSYDYDTDEFNIDQGEWKGRQVGDEITNENPSFVDNKIAEVGHFQGRLVVLTGENRVMSRTNKPLDFWRESATVLADTDAIDDSSTTKSADLQYAIPFNRDLILFGVKAQFVTFGRTALTPVNSSLVLTTEFESDPNVKPVIAGKNIFYAIKYGNFSGIREFFNDSQLDINDARPITQHILKYIEGRITRLSASTTFDILLVATDADPSILYSYEYIWIGNEKKQSSWSKWLFNNPIEYTFFRDGTVYILTNQDSELILEKMELGVQNDEGLTYPVMLDAKVTVNEVNTSLDNPLGFTDDVLVVQGVGCPYPGLLAEIDTITADTITLENDMGGGKVIVGVKYNSRYKPTLPFVKDKDGVSIGTGKLTIAKFLVNFINTGYFAHDTTSQFRPTVSGYFSGRTLGDPEDIIGEPAVVSGQYTVPFREPVGLAELEINSDKHLPFTITDLEWKGQYTKKGQRIQSGGN